MERRAHAKGFTCKIKGGAELWEGLKRLIYNGSDGVFGPAAMRSAIMEK